MAGICCRTNLPQALCLSFFAPVEPPCAFLAMARRPLLGGAPKKDAAALDGCQQKNKLGFGIWFRFEETFLAQRSRSAI